MDEISRGIALAALTLQSVLLQALVHKGVMTSEESLDVVAKSLDAVALRAADDEDDVADVANVCLHGVREALAGMGRRE
jgi:hypothetical protein